MTATSGFPDLFLEFRNMPQKWEEAQGLLNWWALRNTQFLNSKVIGIYSPQILPCGKQFIINNVAYDVFREVLGIGALPNATTASYPHNINVALGFRLVDLYGLANDTTDNKYFRFDMWSKAGQDIEVDIEGANVVVTTQSNYSAYNDSYVVIEYIQGVP
jgi:hypothetical protein